MTRNSYEAENGLLSFGSVYVAHDPVDYRNDDPSMTKQEFRDECDINTLMERYKLSGEMPVPTQTPEYVDAFDLPSYQDALHTMMAAETAFMSLPAVVRREFDNDAARFVEFAQDEKNLPKMREWGLAPPEKEPDAPMRVEVINPAPPAENAP